MKTFIAKSLLACVAATAGATASLAAEGEYYEGIQPRSESLPLDRMGTSSIDSAPRTFFFPKATVSKQTQIGDVDSGDYWKGAVRPQ